ncbi:methionine--tRNA ligase [Luteibaculum oceani]|uniref:methionine--tRNA ligase n=1 Tax=Luteibaculum oceani TaxID=1294296 RepID=UPI001CB968B4|nr:methionine--tRNA ligase [Luteibaculum oceani]
MSKAKRYLVTAALPYANGPLHIGHIAGAYLPADIYVRFLKAQGKDVAFICGSDENGAAITLRAKKEKTTPKEIVDRYHGIIQKAFEDFGMSFDIYHRTSGDDHKEMAQEFFLELHKNQAFEEKKSEQYFDEKEGMFLADRYITGTCPKCSNEGAYGDQCEKCGSALSPDDLINPKSTISGATPVKKETSHWYLPMQQHEDWLRDWLVEGKLEGKETHNPSDWKNNVLGQCKSWIDGGLQSRAMTRDLDWGVPVPLENSEGKVLYVWLDAPIGYVTATKKWADQQKKDWKEYWKSEDSELIHFIGKDNIVFHCIIFPILLKLNKGFNLPANVPANEFLNLEGQKISTSRNWAVWLHEYLEDFPGKQDELRYVLCSIAPETKDSEFTWKDFQARVNNELVAVLGNFVNRALVLTHKYYEGEVPAPNTLNETDKEVLAEAKAIPARVEKALSEYKFREALQHAMSLARLGNKYLADEEPWKQIKTDQERVKTIMSIALEITAGLRGVLLPFLPNTVAKLDAMLNLEPATWRTLQSDIWIEAGHKINKAQLLFSKVEDADIDKQIEKLAQNNKANNQKVKPMKELTDFDTFQKMDLRMAEIKEAVKVPKSSKLFQLKVDIGSEERTVVSGIAKHFSPEDLVGKKVLMLANLAPRKIMGIESQGMLLFAEDDQEKLYTVEGNSDVMNGATVS